MSQSSWRTDPALVAALLPDINTVRAGVGPTFTGLAPYIDAANAMVTNVCVPAPARVSTIQPPYDANQLELIERWLAAHFYAVTDFNLQVQSEGAGDVSQSFASFGSGKGLNMTRWGQTAMTLDYQGLLAAQQQRQDRGVPPRPGVFSLAKKRRPGGAL